MKQEMLYGNMFDEPIKGVRGKLHLFDYPTDENNLPPALKVNLTYPELLCGVLNIPVAKDVFEYAYKTHELTIDIDPTLAETVSEKDGSLKKIQSAVLECGDICMPLEIEEMRVLDHINTELVSLSSNRASSGRKSHGRAW